MKKKLLKTLVCGIFISLMLTGCGETDSGSKSTSSNNSSNSSSASGKKAGTESKTATEKESSSGSVKNPVDVNDFKVLINGQTIAIPTKGVPEMDGYTSYSPEPQSEDPEYKTFFKYSENYDEALVNEWGDPAIFYKGPNINMYTLYVKMESRSDDPVPLSSCYAREFHCSVNKSYSGDEAPGEILFPGDITFGLSYEDCVNVYGTPKKDYKSDTTGETMLFFDYGDYYQIRIELSENKVTEMYMWASGDHPGMK